MGFLKSKTNKKRLAKRIYSMRNDYTHPLIYVEHTGYGFDCNPTQDRRVRRMSYPIYHNYIITTPWTKTQQKTNRRLSHGELLQLLI